MEYKKTKRTNQFIFEGSKHATKRQKINVSAQCKGILLSTVSPRKMSSGIKEFINFLKLNFPEENLENGEIKIKEAATDDHDNDSDRKTSNVEKQLNEEIRKENSDYIRFAPLRNIIKNFTFIKFNNAADKNPSEIVTQIFSMARNKKEKYILRNICKIIPFDCICKPHISPFIKTLLPLLKENFSKGLCVQENFTITNLLKLLNVSEEKTTELANKQDEPQEENGNEDTSKSNENKNGDSDENKNGDNNENKNGHNNENKNGHNNENKNGDNNENKNGDINENKNDETSKTNSQNDNKEKKSENKNETVLNSSGEKKTTWGLIYKCSNTRTLTKKDVLTVLDNCIGNNYSVNLTKPDLAIIVHVTEIMCGISIIRDYDKTRKFNISSFNEDS
ncbi:hypothetical protein PFUGPA_00797 [Plasmodium falciparum Palo Alto/Uganda]|uniref:THUMP domain-containing protein n=3 Tax=Plasmodium falciparum TaxID=5833 RepID=Q8I4U3_PLAF7|nr:conserved protein, unknown function [Plasmodium falciparum 3D7]ETW57308.1 hypothetical protein PFUGPA_00797 [Plasmodium falciparum Palo Alto/Uganda]KAF4327235.1 hypothetical protein CYL21_4717 [Plasmodium falciparum NF54]PKC48607.1 hypothetical protein CK202_2050 [Plasmodium falciparum NF54]CZT99646.1 conserved protein, unknown function [Plasmodium falciparum 3D7]|eukprot:XP_001350875.1 conserved Plasmodium protein, unknown function [Plasmodium falciparum 3D7]